jgi:hypothetical protein
MNIRKWYFYWDKIVQQGIAQLIKEKIFSISWQ